MTSEKYSESVQALAADTKRHTSAAMQNNKIIIFDGTTRSDAVDGDNDAPVKAGCHSSDDITSIITRIWWNYQCDPPGAILLLRHLDFLFEMYVACMFLLLR